MRAENELEIQTSSSFEELSILNHLKSLFPQYTYVSGDRNTLTNPSTKKSLEIDILILKEDEIVCGVEYNGDTGILERIRAEKNLKQDSVKKKVLDYFMSGMIILKMIFM